MHLLWLTVSDYKLFEQPSYKHCKGEQIHRIFLIKHHTNAKTLLTHTSSIYVSVIFHFFFFGGGDQRYEQEHCEVFKHVCVKYNNRPPVFYEGQPFNIWGETPTNKAIMTQSKTEHEHQNIQQKNYFKQQPLMFTVCIT